MIEISKLISCGQDSQPLIQQHVALGSLIIHDHDGVIQRIYVFIQRCKLFFNINEFYTNQKIIDLIGKKIHVLSTIQTDAHPDQNRIQQIQEVVKNSLDCFFVENTDHEKVYDLKLEKHIKNLHKSLQQIRQEPATSLEPPNAQGSLEPLSHKEPQENNILQGKGKMILSDGAIYEGDFVDGVFQGKGTYTFPDGETYEGDFVHDVFQGKGTYTFPDGAIYKGDFVHDVFQGKGKMILSDGATYEGDFVDGLFQGKGIYTWPGGKTYEGDFVNDARTGKGKMTFPDGKTLEGDFIDGVLRRCSPPVFSAR